MVAEENKQLSRTKKRSEAQGHHSSKPKNGKNNKSKWLLYTGIAFVAFLIGSMVGYGYLGERNALEVLDLDTWLHMYRLIFG